MLCYTYLCCILCKIIKWKTGWICLLGNLQAVVCCPTIIIRLCQKEVWGKSVLNELLLYCCLLRGLFEVHLVWSAFWVKWTLNGYTEFSVPVSIYLHYTAMGALSEESAITASSLSTDLRNNWTKNNAEGTGFFVLFVSVNQLGKRHNQQTKTSTKICYASCCDAPSLGHCWICEMSWFLHGAFETCLE